MSVQKRLWERTGQIIFLKIKGSNIGKVDRWERTAKVYTSNIPTKFSKRYLKSVSC
jgi:hypothetical protein